MFTKLHLFSPYAKYLVKLSTYNNSQSRILLYTVYIYIYIFFGGTTLKSSKFYSGRNEEQIEVRECLLLFGAESCRPVCYPKI